MPPLDFEKMSLQDFVDLRDRVDRELKRRFERSLALFFTDIVSSTQYISRYGNVAGRELFHRHHAILNAALANCSARLVDTAGDGAFCAANSVADAVAVLIRFHRLLLEDNAQMSPDSRLSVRSGVHWGPVLADESRVSGEAVHAAARIGNASKAGEIRLSNPAFRELPIDLRSLCERLPPQSVKGILEPMEMLSLDWRDTRRFPTRVEVVETGTVLPIPTKSRVTFGRLVVYGDEPANDIILEHPDPTMHKRISRWQFDLDMGPEGYLLRPRSQALTELDGHLIPQGEAVLVRVGSVARVSDVLTLRLLGPEDNNEQTSLAANRPLGASHDD